MTTEFVISLDKIADSYSVFEENQVLTDDQLNSITEYLDDQQRLTRVNLIGVGIACGLWPSLSNWKVEVSRGVGVTTDGDMMLIAKDTVYDRYKKYDSAAPDYRRFIIDGNRIPLFELLREGDKPDDAAEWSQLRNFTAKEGLVLENLVALLHMQSYIKDDDLCTGTDCDNKGQGAKHALKVLLTTRNAAAKLAKQTEVLDPTIEDAQDLRPVAVHRPVLAATVTSAADVARMYQEACKEINAALLQELPRIYRRCESALKPIFAHDPAPVWDKLLRGLAARADIRGNQYYYDFLKDLAETYNAFCEQFGDNAVCCPDMKAFEKHLLLGNLVRGVDPDENRTAFYPSPAADHCCANDHARFLIRKFDILVRSFELPGSNSPIRITPSFCEDHCLEDRTIPYYYSPQNLYRVRHWWSYEHMRRGRERYLYGYHVREHGALGAAMQPFAAQIGRFDFFRIEGHLGKGVSGVVGQLRRAITDNNLPFFVQALRLNREVRWVFPEPPFQVTDLHGFRHLLREDLATVLEDAAGFGGKLQTQIEQALQKGDITKKDNDDAEIKGPADEKIGKIAVHAPQAAKLLRAASTVENDGWRMPLGQAVEAAAELKDHLGKVSKNHFASPLDVLIDNPQWRWLALLDNIIKDRESKEADNSMLPGFLAKHPGLEHFAGVARGGTFVVVYDEKEMVVADFMLPYICCEPQRFVLPPLKPPPAKPGIVFEKPIWLTPIVNKLWFTKYADEIKAQTKLDTQYFEGFTKSLGVLGSIFGVGGKNAVGAESVLAAQMNNYIKASESVKNAEALPNLTPNQRKDREKKLKNAQMRLTTAKSTLKSLGIG